MTHASTPVASTEVTAIDSTARGPLLYLIGSGIAWLLVSGVLALITSIQLHSPHFLADCSWLTHGRAQALRETSFVYGWLANSGLAIALWILARLGGEPLRARNWLLFGAVFWNLALVLGLIGIAGGDMTSFSLYQLPRYVQPLMFFAFAAMAVAAVLAWTGRRNEQLFAAQWYAIAALLLFPWLWSAVQIVLLWSPVRGTVQSVAAGWYAQSAWTLWLAPMALAAAYYLIPKIGGRAIRSYDFASLGFWTLIAVGGWSGGRHLIGGPVPVWVPTMAVAATMLLLGHYAIVFLNLRGAFGASGNAIKYVTFGISAYLLGGILDAFSAFRGVAERMQFTFASHAQQELALYGAVSMIFFGAIYFAVPRLTGRPWASAALIAGHRVLVSLGVILLVLALAVAGWKQGADLLQAEKSFADINAGLKPMLLAASAANLVLLGANLLLLVNFARSVCVCRTPATSDLSFRQPATMEATAL